MKKFVLILTGILLCLNSFSQTGNWDWAQRLDSSSESGQCIASE